jgi:hypothetical protein
MSAPVAPRHRTALAGHPGVDWRQVLTRLDPARSAVFERLDPAGLAAVDLPGSQAYRYDAAAVAAL